MIEGYNVQKLVGLVESLREEGVFGVLSVSR